MQHTCYHCGESCNESIQNDEKFFCCEGCKQVYLMLNENGLCNYYDLEKNPGITAKGRFTDTRFAYLDNQDVQQKLLRFREQGQAHVQFYLPTMHCASCIWLLENLHRIHPGILSSKTHFQRKEVFIQYDESLISLRKVVELLAFTGYEPYITLNDGEKKKEKKVNRSKIFKIGVAGFAFSNIMMLSFPDYLAFGNIEMEQLRLIFSWLSLALSLPVIFYSASEFFISGYKGLRQKWLNIDAPIALAILITFSRSVYEIITATGPGYLDSMSGIVFFMLIGRWFQDRTYDAFSFERDYRSYFPLGVTILKDGSESNLPISDLKKGDIILVRNEEMIPADGILKEGKASVDYSFVSGENTPVEKQKGELVYAGGKQIGTSITVEVVTPVSQSYITKLWNNDIFKTTKHKEQSFIHPWSRYFTYALFLIATFAGVYWSINDPSKVWPAITAVLIVACPCSLLLSATFTFGNVLSLLGRSKLYLKNANVIETLGQINTIVFDKTGTITHNQSSLIYFEGDALNDQETQIIRALTKQSTHPLSRQIAATLEVPTLEVPTLEVEAYQEIAGKGLEAQIDQHTIRLGSYSFVHNQESSIVPGVHISLNNTIRGRFMVSNRYREGLPNMIQQLKTQGYDLHVLSGDNDQERINLQDIFGYDVPIHFNHTPQGKLDYIQQLQQKGKKVMMLGDGLNDAGALRQADAGIAVTDSTNLFSPASDGILDGSMLHKLDKPMHFAKESKTIITASFILSILYNIVGLTYATQALLSPVIAAILMPASSISIVSFVSIYARIKSRKMNH